MASFNRAEIMGNLCADPDLRFTPNGSAVTTLRVATNEYYKGKDGVAKHTVDFHNLVVWGKAAEACSKYLSKGRMVMAEGRLKTRMWEDKNGVKHYTTEVICSRVQFLPKAAPSTQTTQGVDETPETQVEDTEEHQVQQPLNASDIIFQRSDKWINP